MYDSNLDRTCPQCLIGFGVNSMSSTLVMQVDITWRKVSRNNPIVM